MKYVLVINAARAGTKSALKEFKKIVDDDVELIVLREMNYKPTQFDVDDGLKIIECDMEDPADISQKISTYREGIVSVVARSEHNALLLSKIIPLLPYNYLPTESSLVWATSKYHMRKLFASYNSDITPPYIKASESIDDTVKSVNSEVGYPVIVKPSGLHSSLLISECKNETELKGYLSYIFKNIDENYKLTKRNSKPIIIIEKKIIGKLYSVDSFINSKGHVRHAPLCSYLSGQDVGIDDFFVYRRDTPVNDLNEEEVTEAKDVATDGLRALGLKSTSAHIELIHTEEGGWYIIEIGPRLGRFREQMYDLSYGIDHSLNDILIRYSDDRLELSNRRSLHSAAISVFSKNEGKIVGIDGIEKSNSLESVSSIRQILKIGDTAKFSKNGGKVVIEALFVNEDRNKLDEDILKFENNIIISVE